MAVTFTTDINALDGLQTEGFFVGWPVAPTPADFHLMLRNATHVVLAIDTEDQRLVGFVNANGDQVMSAYIPLLEVLPAYQGQGIGTQLMQKMLIELCGYYMVDLTCEASVQSFYERLGLRPYVAMTRRDFRRLAQRS